MAESKLISSIEEFETEYKKGIGQVLSYRPMKEANLDNIRRFGDGVGDYNPLWRDEEYASESRYNMLENAAICPDNLTLVHSVFAG